MVVETRLYDILAISPAASGDEISKSYKKIALKCHPDKTNHDPQLTEKFKQVTRAYEVLKDSNARKVYDKYGESGLDGRAPPPPTKSNNYQGNNFKFRSATDVFSQVFSDFNSAFGDDAMGLLGSHFGFGGAKSFGGFDPFGNMNMNMNMASGFPDMDMHFNMGFGGGNAANGKSGDFRPNSTQGMKKTVRPVDSFDSNERKIYKGKNIFHTCKVTLEDLCYGKTIKLQLPRRSKCEACKGEGGFNKSLCKTCRGKGRVVTTLSNQFTKYQEVGLCPDCQGTGTLYSSLCKQCDDGYVVANKIIALSVLPGTKDGDQIVVKSAGDEGRNIIPGDVIIKIKQEKHPFLIRRFNDLYMEYDIDLKTALLGGTIVIKDFLKRGNDLRVFINVHGNDQLNATRHESIQAGEVVGTINPGTPKIVKGSGMPINNYGTNGVYYQTEDSALLLDPSAYIRGDLFIKFNVQLPSIKDFKNGASDLTALDHILPSGNSEHDAMVDSVDMTDEQRLVVDTHLGNLPNFSESPKPPFKATHQHSFSSSDSGSGSSETLISEPDHKKHKGIK